MPHPNFEEACKHSPIGSAPVSTALIRHDLRVSFLGRVAKMIDAETKKRRFFVKQKSILRYSKPHHSRNLTFRRCFHNICSFFSPSLLHASHNLHVSDILDALCSPISNEDQTSIRHSCQRLLSVSRHPNDIWSYLTYILHIKPLDRR